VQIILTDELNAYDVLVNDSIVFSRATLTALIARSIRSPRIRKRKDEDMTLIPQAKDMTYTKTPRKTDKQIQLNVLAEIARDFRFKPAELRVEVDAGVVTLTGTVTSYPTLALAAEIAGNVPSVKDVANKLTVEIAPHAVRDDTRIAQAVRNALEYYFWFRSRLHRHRTDRLDACASLARACHRGFSCHP